MTERKNSPLLKLNLESRYIIVQKHKDGIIGVIGDSDTTKELLYEALLRGGERIVRWAMPIPGKKIAAQVSVRLN